MAMAVAALAAAWTAVAAATATFVTALTFGAGLMAGVSAWTTVISVVGLGAALLMKPPGLGSQGQQVNIQMAGPDHPIPLIIGRTGTQGIITYRGTHGNKNDVLLAEHVLSVGPVDAIESFSVMGRALTFSGSPSSGMATVTQVQGVDMRTSKLFRENGLRVAHKVGVHNDTSTLSSITGDTVPFTNSNDTMPGLARTVVRCKLDEKRLNFPNGYPDDPISVVRGVKCYDPRLDSTQTGIGGSGSHRVDDAATHEWSENPFIVALNFALGWWSPIGTKMFGLGMEIDMIDVAAFVAAANVADANDWTVGGQVSSQDGDWSIIHNIMASGGGVPIDRAGKLSCFVRAPKIATFTLKEADILGGRKVSTSTAISQRVNRIIPHCRQADQKWEVIAGEAITDETWLEQDGGNVRTEEITFPLVNSFTQAHQLAAYHACESREFLEFEVTAKPRALAVDVGDCIEVELPEFTEGQTFIVMSRKWDAAQKTVQMLLKAETFEKHAFALGQSPDAPEAPTLVTFDPTNPDGPDADDWEITGTSIDQVVSGSTRSVIPALVINGEVRDPNVQKVVVEIREPISEADVWPGGTPGDLDEEDIQIAMDDFGWLVGTDAHRTATEITLAPLRADTEFEISIRYEMVSGAFSARRILAPATTAQDQAGGVAPGTIDWDPTSPDSPIINVPGVLTDLAPGGGIRGVNVTVEGTTDQDLVTVLTGLDSGISDLVDVYGDTVSAIAARDAAIAAQTLAETAQTAAETAFADASAAASDSDAARAASVTAQGLAEGFRDGAQTAATASATSATSSATSATASSAALVAAETARDAASGSASAAATSATGAATSATDAGTSASAASTAQVAAESARDAASGSASAASTSASGASTSATDAGNSATAANTSQVAARSSASATFPRDFSQDGRFWTSDFSSGSEETATAPTGTFLTVSGIGRVWQGVVGYTDGVILPRQPIPMVAGQKWQFKAKVRYAVLPGGGQPIFIYGREMGADFAYVGGQTLVYSNDVRSTTNSWVEIQTTVTVPATVTAPYFRPEVRGGDAGVGQIQVAYFDIENITESAAAGAAASAAATSASSASTSASAAGSSATSANTSATNAATSAGAASTSETNASNSATTASGHAATATTQAGLAATSAGAAGTSATAAAGSASTAATQATNASNSATAASASQVAAASSYGDAIRATRNGYFNQGGDGWIDYGSGSLASSYTGRNNVYLTTVGASSTLRTDTPAMFPIRPGENWRLSIGFRTAAATTVNHFYIGLFFYDEAGGLVGGTDGTGNYPLAAYAPFSVADGWQDRTVIVGPGAPSSPYGGTTTFPAGATRFQLVAFYNYSSDAAGSAAFDYFTAEPATGELAAATSATAAATSASSASTSASAAGSSATAASGSATTATTQASNAGTSATNSATSATGAAGSATAAAGSATTAGTHASTASTHATTASTQASNASASASSASSSATIAAGVGHRALNRNAGFDGYPASSGRPTDWNSWDGSESAGAMDRVADGAGGYSIKMTSSAGSPQGVQQLTEAGTFSPDTYYVIEMEAELHSGAWTGSGVYLAAYNAAASGSVLWNDYASMATAEDASGFVSSSRAGRRAWSRLVKTANDASISRAYIYVMSHWSGHGSIAAANQITFHKIVVRPATSQEIAAGVALPALQASVSTTQTTVASLETNYELARYSVAATTGGGAAILTLTSDTYGTIAGLDAAKIYFGDNTVFDNSVDVLVTTWGSNCRITAWGASFGTDSTLTEWEGPTSVTWGNHSRANAYFYRANVAPYAGGSALAPVAPFAVSQSHTTRVGTRMGAGSATTGTVTLTPTGHTGTVTYTWANVFGDSSLGATASTSAATAFNGSVAANQEKQAQFAWTASDSGTGKTVTGYCSATIIDVS